MKLNKLRQDLIDLLKDSNLSEQTIDMVFMEFEANNSITIRRPRFADDMNDEELLAYIADKDK